MFSPATNFSSVVKDIVNMTRDTELCTKVKAQGFNIINVMWEDTARTAGSCWGANITDMTLQVRVPGGKSELLPVIRHPNFADKTADVAIDKMRLKVGNQDGQDLKNITLRDYLTNLPEYIHDKSSINRENGVLITAKDTHILVSAQACFLPIPKGENAKCEFNPVLFNYQSRKDSPAVLAVMVTPEGTSATVLNNHDDKASWGQNVLFNLNGQKTCLTGQRITEYKEDQAKTIAAAKGISVEEARSQVKVDSDINLVMLVQIPLKHKELSYGGGFTLEACSFGGAMKGLSSPVLYRGGATRGGRSSDVEDAVIGHGKDEGKHLELGGAKLERDERFPIRVTVQFYKATSNGVVSEEDLANVQACINAVYDDADYIGSLVMGTLEKGSLGMGQARPTQPAPLAKAVITPPDDYLAAAAPLPAVKLPVVSPFSSNQKPTT